MATCPPSRGSSGTRLKMPTKTLMVTRNSARPTQPASVCSAPIRAEPLHRQLGHGAEHRERPARRGERVVPHERGVGADAEEPGALAGRRVPVAEGRGDVTGGA